MTFDPTIIRGTTELDGTIDDLVDRLAPSPSVLVAIWAHPDDGSVLGAGLMAEIAGRGGRVVSVTATVGEHGTPDPQRQPPASLVIERRREPNTA